MVSQQLSILPTFPRILIVTRRTIRKNKYVDFVGEYHLSLLLQNNAIPVLIPRVPPTSTLLEAYQPFDGLLLVEGEDIGPSFRPTDTTLPPESLAAVADAHPGDTHPDLEKDSIEFALVHKALAQGIPIFAICRGAQVVNVAAGGDLLPDINLVLDCAANVQHIDYNNYDNHRHPIHIVPSTPLHQWFDRAHSIDVNSYHHQAISHLASRFVPMAHAPDGLIEAYYDPHCYDPENGKFIVGLQFHPERMQDATFALADDTPMYDYSGCPRPYQQFVIAAAAYRHNRLMRLQPLIPDIPLKPNPTHQLSTSLIPDHLDNFRTPLSTDTRMSNRYSQDDLNRIIRSGGTVHGSSLVLRMLQKENACNNVPSLNNMNVDIIEPRGRNQWKRFRCALEQAERALHGLSDQRKIEEALALLERLSDVCSNVMSENSDKIFAKRLHTRA